MKRFACWCRDAESSAAPRERELEAHLAHVEAHIERYAVAGPLKRRGETVGSLLVVRADNAEAARAFLEADPYFAAGVWRSVEIEELRAIAGDWVGGAAWKVD